MRPSGVRSVARRSPSVMAAATHSPPVAESAPVSAVTSPPPPRLASTSPSSVTSNCTGPRLDATTTGRPGAVPGPGGAGVRPGGMSPSLPRQAEPTLPNGVGGSEPGYTVWREGPLLGSAGPRSERAAPPRAHRVEPDRRSGGTSLRGDLGRSGDDHPRRAVPAVHPVPDADHLRAAAARADPGLPAEPGRHVARAQAGEARAGHAGDLPRGVRPARGPALVADPRRLRPGEGVRPQHPGPAAAGPGRAAEVRARA